MRPSLFGFATSELSQDAFVCWLCAWADPKYSASDPMLHAAGISFIDTLFERIQRPKPEGYWSVEVRRQCEKVDILVKVNNETFIIIEDKIDSREHSDQLVRYRSAITKRFECDDSVVHGVYLKTGDQGDYRLVDDSGFARLSRTDLLSVLDAGAEAGIQNDIFLDFRQHLRTMNDEVDAFRTAALSAWSPRAWAGLYAYFQERLNDGNWGYVSNPRGGFMGFWWHGDDGGKYYLQLEDQKLCFKIHVAEQERQRGEWERWWAALNAASETSGTQLKKGLRRAGSGVTVAVLTGGYLHFDESGSLDGEGTIAILKRAEALFDEALRNVSASSRL